MIARIVFRTGFQLLIFSNFLSSKLRIRICIQSKMPNLDPKHWYPVPAVYNSACRKTYKPYIFLNFSQKPELNGSKLTYWCRVDGRRCAAPTGKLPQNSSTCGPTGPPSTAAAFRSGMTPASSTPASATSSRSPSTRRTRPASSTSG